MSIDYADMTTSELFSTARRHWMHVSRILSIAEARAEAATEAGPTIAALQDETGRINAAHGWREGETTPAEQAALIMTEVAEIIEGLRDPDHDVDETYYLRGPDEDRPKPEGVPSELADVVIRCMDFADRYGIDLEAAIVEKLAYNETRGYRHGGKRL